MKILDPHNQRYEVPEFAFPRPSSTPNQQSSRSHIRFDITPSPFSFAVVRRSNDETLFDTKDHPLVFENQYLRVKTSLPEKANIYGLGEHSETLRLDERNTTRTMWAGDFGIPRGLNLYGVHPVYIEHRTTGSHGVFLLNSDGMDIKLRADEATGTSLEYNVIGGVLDFYFFAGPSPADVSRQYAQVAGLPAMTPYWNLGVSGSLSRAYLHIPVPSSISTVNVCVAIMLTKCCNACTCSSINGMLVLVFCFFSTPPPPIFPVQVVNVSDGVLI